MTIFFGEPNAELCEAARRLWLGSRGRVGSERAFAPIGGRSTELSIAGHDAQCRRVSAEDGCSRGQRVPRGFKPSHVPRKLRRSPLVL